MIKCARNVDNVSSITRTDRFDKETFNPRQLINNLKVQSPKMLAMLKKIKSLDESCYAREKKLYKHFIFSDVSPSFGAKAIASVFVALGFNLITKPKGKKIVINDDVLRIEDYNNFAILSNTLFWGSTYEKKTIKEILKIFNDRTENVYGKKIRFIIIDNSFKEGIDLLDVRYGHIFEKQSTTEDLVQAIGRGTRYCGQIGLPFKNGWKLDVYNYQSVLQNNETLLDFIARNNPESLFGSTSHSSMVSLFQEASINKPRS